MKLPITFAPIFKERIWGGRQLEKMYQKSLPNEGVYGESWEMVDREGDVSVVSRGQYQGQTLHQLWKNSRREIFGEVQSTSDRFPLLLKILDAQTNLSVQAHPSDELAQQQNEETKHECWYVAHAEPHAKIYKGLKEGKTKEDLLTAIARHDVSSCLQSHLVSAGDFIYIPSGEVHALGAGVVVFEIQQNSDTTYRLYDWGRIDVDGQPRELHLEQAIKSLEQEQSVYPLIKQSTDQQLLETPYFTVAHQSLSTKQELQSIAQFQIIIIIGGELIAIDGSSYVAGDFLLLPSEADALTASLNTSILKVTLP